MTANAFFDTNILLYAGSSATADAHKQRIAEGLLLNVPFCLSAQVLQEYIANALSKKALGLGEENIASLLEACRVIEVLPITRDLIIQASSIRRRYGISHWDATIVAAAAELHCEILYTEDLNHGQDYDGVRVINPFIPEKNPVADEPDGV